MKRTSYFVIIINYLIISFIFAGDSGELRGRIVDKSTKQPLAGANIEVLETVKGAATDLEGYFRIESLDENIYKLQISYIGYESLVIPDVRIIRNKKTYLAEIELTKEAMEGEAIVVTAGAFQSDEEQPVSFSKYTSQEIWRAPGAGGDIFRAVEVLPGVSTSGGEFSAFSVRGGNPKDNLILVDNIPFDKVAHFDDDQENATQQGGRFSVFSPGIIESASFQGGGFPAKYGGKNASLLSLSVKEGNRDDFSIRGQYDFLGWEAAYDGPAYIIDNTGILFSARNQDFETILDMIGEKQEGVPSFTDIIFKSTTDINASNRISLLGIYAPEEYNRDIHDVFESENLENNKLVNNSVDKSLLGLNWRLLTSKTSFLKTTLYHTYSFYDEKIGLVYTDPVNGVYPTKQNVRLRKNAWQSNQKENVFGFKSEFSNSFSNGSSFTSGIELQWMDFKQRASINGQDTLYVFGQDDYRADPAQKYLIISPDFMNSYYEKDKYNVSVYSQYSAKLNSALTMNLGLRADYSKLYKQTDYSPRFSLSCQLNPKTSVNAAAGLYYQQPQMRLIASKIDNNKLENERAAHFILGVSRLLKDDLKFTAETYYKKLDNLVVRPDRAKYIFSNSGDGWAAGIDMSLVKRFDDKFYGQMSYSYSMSKRNDHNGEGNYNSDFNQPHIFNILGGYQFNKEWSVSAKWKYAAGRPIDSYIVHADVHNNLDYMRYSQEVTSNNTTRLPDVHSLNLRVDYRKQFFTRLALISYLDIMNVYGRKNPYDEVFLERSGKVEYAGLETMPVIGLKLEF